MQNLLNFKSAFINLKRDNWVYQKMPVLLEATKSYMQKPYACAYSFEGVSKLSI